MDRDLSSELFDCKLRDCDGSLFYYVLDILSQEGWGYEFDHDECKIYLMIHGVNYNFHASLLIDNEQESLLCQVYINEKVAYDKRPTVMEYIIRINSMLINGNFDFNLDNGQILFRTFLDMSNCIPSKEQILNLIWNGVQCFDTYYPGFFFLVNERKSIQESIEYCSSELNE